MKAEAIVYTSCTGNTRRYAYMLGKAANLPVLDLKEANLAPNTPVIYLGWLMAGGVKGLKQARKRFDVRAVCAVGMAVPSKEGKEKMAVTTVWTTACACFTCGAATPPNSCPGCTGP